MYFKIILLFSGAVCISAVRSYEVKLCHSYGCFDTSDTELFVMLNEDEVYYADFKKGEIVWDGRVPFAAHFSWAYKYAEYYRASCKNQMESWKQDKSAVTKARDAPESIIYSRDEVTKEVENTLICFINRFFPPSIKVKWIKNNEEVTAEESFIQSLPNLDGTFHVLSTLQSRVRFWTLIPTFLSVLYGTGPSSGPGVFCGLGLSLGLLGVATGTFLFVKGNHYE
ncbi:HLA class II histocompatibility antigen, DP alpha 1 chain-like [Centroberyx affinis]|uniref:HLA class II histocompatibility antigen, DP alpha 1 chain-like n=1 Tax=Centroberyx affinis TaxID=166261 RepID=UPI003A5C244B